MARALGLGSHAMSVVGRTFGEVEGVTLVPVGGGLRSLGERLFDTAERYPDERFLIGREQASTYAATWNRIMKLAAGLAGGSSPFVGIFAERGEFAYLSILAALAAGKTYVPLNARMPDDKLAAIVNLSELDTICVGAGMVQRAGSIAGMARREVRAICETMPETAEPDVGARLESAASFDQPLTGPRTVEQADGGAYLFFTSGSTGQPKGVLVRHENVLAYLDYICPRYGYGPGDVHSQTFELSFDLSVHDMMCAWTTGGAIVPLVGGALLAPQRLLVKHQITCWFSVPSVALLMQRQRALMPESLSTLRVSLFCGEALPAGLSDAWKSAAPRSVVDNLYGPTEATIAITHYRWGGDEKDADIRHGLTPIGNPFDGQRAEILDADSGLLVKTNAPATGELVLAGSQVTGGYYNAPEITAQRYRRIDDVLWYRTGDLVERDEHGVLHFLGRLDFQIKMNGYRIELAEVENALRKAAATDEAVVVPWPADGGPVEQLIAVVAGTALEADVIRSGLARLLAGYLMPRRIEVWDDLPVNINSKFDRKAIIAKLSGTTR
ncbi:MAG: AMP-binding protein [Rhizobiaceae bacterium]|nr:AMP-binding protein [Rhizobiaceae bacterium]